ncbi:MAG: ion channel [Bacillota bacterium]
MISCIDYFYGYGDISPVTGLGRIIAAFLMIIGIGFIGMLTGTIATFFLDKTRDNTVQHVSKTVDLSELDEGQFDQVMSFVEFVKSRK